MVKAVAVSGGPADTPLRMPAAGVRLFPRKIMKEIAIHAIAPGQVLAADVFDDRGGLLLSKGMRLSPDHVELLERRGVLTVSIVDGDAGAGGPPAEPDRNDFATAIERVDHMFEGLDDDPVMRAIHTAARKMLESAREDGTPL
ncbi:MAG: hypothetical protein ACYTKD_09165 [Planctomycetota bacterium]